MVKRKSMAASMGQNHPLIQELDRSIEVIKDLLKTLIPKAPGELPQELEKARREFVEAEVEYRVREQEANLARARSQKRLEVLDEQWRSLTRQRAESREPSLDLERKLDELLREVRELRREIKK